MNNIEQKCINWCLNQLKQAKTIREINLIWQVWIKHVDKMWDYIFQNAKQRVKIND